MHNPMFKWTGNAFKYKYHDSNSIFYEYSNKIISGYDRMIYFKDS